MASTISGKTAETSGNSDKVERAADTASSSAHAAVDSAAKAADDVANKAGPAIDHVAEMAHRAVDSAVEAAKPTADWIAEHGESLQASQQKFVSDTCSYVTAHPFKSLGMAVLAGFVLGRILRR